MRRSFWLRPEMKKAFKKDTNRNLRRESKKATENISKRGYDADNIALCPVCRKFTIWDYD